VSERLSIDDVPGFQREAHAAVDGLVSLTDQERTRADGISNLDVVARAAPLALTASAASLGECRCEEPYASIYPLIDSDGVFKWCCTHNPSHSSP
jgi:hypothetical protein